MMCERQTWVGAFVLDALEPEECEALRLHIADCAICQDEVVSLAWIPAVLRNVTFEGVEGIDESTESTLQGKPSPVMLERLLASMDDDRRSRRLSRPAAFLVGVAAAITIGGAVAIGNGAFNGTHHPPVVSAVRAVDPGTQVNAAVTMTGQSWGTELHLTLSWVAPGQQCSLVAHARDGRSDVAATWTATYQGTADVPGTTAIPADQLSELDVVASDGRQLVRLVVPHKTK
jgi:hypothetical protein